MKYGISAYYHFINCFQTMPIAALLDTSKGKIFCVHGGISPHLLDLEKIDQIDRRREPATDGPLCDLLWSDPHVEDEEENYQAKDLEMTTSNNNKHEELWSTNLVRGCSYYFKAQALYAFLQQNDLICMIRAHEYEEKGFLYHFERQQQQQDKSLFPPMMTVFSAPNYCDFHQNMGAFMILCDHLQEFTWEIKQFNSVSHPIPQLFGAERSFDMWKEFRKTCPFIPASKIFFEQVLDLASQERKGSFSLSDILPPALTGATSAVGRRLSIGGGQQQQQHESLSSMDTMTSTSITMDDINHPHHSTTGKNKYFFFFFFFFSYLFLNKEKLHMHQIEMCTKIETLYKITKLQNKE
jgi:diadenosine tetraphosphatase ApaH/serine/threonine PP2A family protein phosphatase